MGSYISYGKSQIEILENYNKKAQESLDLAKEFEELDPEIEQDIETGNKVIKESENNINEFITDITSGKILNKKEPTQEPISSESDCKIPKLHMLTFSELSKLSEEELMFDCLKFQIWNSGSEKLGIFYEDSVDIAKIENTVRKIKEANFCCIKEIRYKSRKLLIIFDKDWLDEQSDELFWINDFIYEVYLNRLYFLRGHKDFKKTLSADLMTDEMQLMFSYMKERGYEPLLENYRLILNCNW